MAGGRSPLVSVPPFGVAIVKPPRYTASLSVVGQSKEHGPRRASPGFTLFAPVTGPGMVYLIDIQGNVSHTWKMPYPPGVYGYLTDRGTLFYNGKIPNDTFIGKAPFMGGAAMEVDWNGKVLWEIKQPDHHHDGRLLRNGNVLLLCSTELPADIAKRVKVC